MTVALLALGISLGGNAIAAHFLVTSSKQIKAGVITSSHVKNRTLKLKDFKAGERSKLRGPAGATGPAGIAGAAGAAGVKGDKGDTGAPGPVGQIQGALAAGDLTGTYPDPVIGALVVTAAKLAVNAVTNEKIADDAVGNAEMLNNAVGNTEMADNAVGNAEMVDNAVGNTEMADNAVGTNEVQLDSLAAADLAASSVGTSEVNNRTLTLDDFAVAEDPNISTGLSSTVAAGACVSTNTGFGGVAVGDYVFVVPRSITAGIFTPPVRVTTGGQFPLTFCNYSPASIGSISATTDHVAFRP